MLRPLTNIALLLLMAGCASFSYRGDGKLSDSGPFASHRRYVLDLGTVDLGHQVRREYKIAGLPTEDFTLGIQTSSTKTPDGQSLSAIKPIRARVRLELTSEQSGKVFEIADDLRSWTWNEARDSYIFLYGSTRQPSTTYFTPKSGESYRLVLEVISPDPAAAQYKFSLLAVGGGWK